MMHGTAVLNIILVLSILMQTASGAQQPGKVYRIGYLSISPGNYETDAHNCPIGGTPYWQSTMVGLRERGYVQGRNLVMECRYSENQSDRAQLLGGRAREPRTGPHAGQRHLTGPGRMQTTRTIPIVMYGVIDPVGRG